jgi:hypothetical protein
VFPTVYEIAEPLQNKIKEKLVDKKGEVKNDLWVLASSCNENLKKKMAKMPERQRVKEEKPEQTKSQTQKIEPKVEMRSRHTNEKEAGSVKKEELVGSKRNVTQASLAQDEIKEPPNKRARIEKEKSPSPPKNRQPPVNQNRGPQNAEPYRRNQDQRD